METKVFGIEPRARDRPRFVSLETIESLRLDLARCYHLRDSIHENHVPSQPMNRKDRALECALQLRNSTDGVRVILRATVTIHSDHLTVRHHVRQARQ